MREKTGELRGANMGKHHHRNSHMKGGAAPKWEDQWRSAGNVRQMPKVARSVCRSLILNKRDDRVSLCRLAFSIGLSLAWHLLTHCRLALPLVHKKGRLRFQTTRKAFQALGLEVSCNQPASVNSVVNRPGRGVMNRKDRKCRRKTPHNEKRKTLKRPIMQSSIQISRYMR